MNTFKTIDRRSVLRTAAAAGAFSVISPWVARAAVTRVPVVMTGGVTGLALQEIGVSQGYFKEFDLDPEILVVSDGTKAVSALVSGASDICMWSGFNQLTPAIEKGATLKIVAGALSLPSLALFSKKPDVKSLKDLEGKTVGIGALGAVLHQMIVLMLMKKGVDLKRITFVNVGANPDIFKAVVAGTIDAGISDVDVFEQQGKYGVHALTDGLLWEQIPEYTNQGSYVSDESIAKRREQLVRILAAYGKIYRDVSGPNSADAYIKAREKVTGQNDEHAALTQWNWIRKYQPYAKDLVLTDDQINLVQKLNVDFEVQKAVLPITKVADMSIAKDALKLMK